MITARRPTKLPACVAMLAVLLARGPLPKKQVVATLRSRGFGIHTIKKSATMLGVVATAPSREIPHDWSLPPTTTQSLPGLFTFLHNEGRTAASRIISIRYKQRKRVERAKYLRKQRRQGRG